MKNVDKESNKTQPRKHDISKMYSIARRIANMFYRRHNLTYLDRDDFVQEAMLGWMQGRPMYFAMMDAFRRAAPLARSQVGKLPLPKNIPITNEWSGAVRDLSAGESITLKRVLISQIKELISGMDDETKDVMNRYFFQDGAETLADIGKDYGVTGSAIYLKKKRAIKILKSKTLTQGDVI